MVNSELQAKRERDTHTRDKLRSILILARRLDDARAGVKRRAFIHSFTVDLDSLVAVAEEVEQGIGAISCVMS